MLNVHFYSDEIKELRNNFCDDDVLEIFNGEDYIRTFDNVIIGITRYNDGTYSLEYDYAPKDRRIMSVCWFSRHDMTKEQKESLINYVRHQYNSEIDIFKVDFTANNWKEVLEASDGADFICAVLPPKLLSDVFQNLESHQTLLVPKNKRVRNEEGQYEFKHAGWDEILKCVYMAQHIE